MSRHVELNSHDDEVDAVWGAEAVGAVIGRSASQVYYLLRIGVLDGAVKKLGNKTIVGSRRRLRELVTSD